jgi:hypothetical protein
VLARGARAPAALVRSLRAFAWAACGADGEDALAAGVARVARARWEQPRDDARAPRVAAELPVAALAWAAGGARLFAACGRRDHGGWCRHAGGVAVWATGARASGSAMPLSPETLVELGVCATAVAAHPDEPSVLAAGAFDGTITVWDVSAAGAPALVAATPADADYLHRDAVVGLAWARDGARGFGLRSVSADGRAHAWTLANGLAFPVASALLETAGASPVQLGAAALALPGAGAADGGGAAAAALVGTDAGTVARVTLRVTDAAHAAAVAPADGPAALAAGAVPNVETTLPWARAAADALGRVPDAAERGRAARAAERVARTRGARGVGLGELWAARPPERTLFCSPVALAGAPVHAGARTAAITASPTVRGLWASAGSAGAGARGAAAAPAPLLVIEPRARAGAAGGSADAVEGGGSGGGGVDGGGGSSPHGGGGATAGTPTPLTSIAWAAARPLLLAAGSAAGDVFVFDLFASTAGEPAATLAPSGAMALKGGAGDGAAAPPPWAGAPPAGAATALAFAPAAPRALAVGYASGAVCVGRRPAHLAAASPGEAEAAALFLQT